MYLLVAVALAAALTIAVLATRKYGTTWTLKWPLSPRFFFITEPRVLEHVLKTNFTGYEKGPYFHENLVDLLGDGIFNSDGDKWHVQRKLAAHMFSRREFEENIMDTFNRHGAVLESILNAAVASGEPLDLQNLFFRFTLDSIGAIAFGDDIGALRNPDVPFARAFDEAQAAVEHRFFEPGWRITELLDGSRARINAAIRVLDEYCYALIRQRRAKGDFMHRRDLLSRFMSVTDDGTDGGAAEAGAVPAEGVPGSEDAGAGGGSVKYRYLHNDKFLRDVILNFMIAGRDTTAQALSWTVFNLSQHPEVEAEMLSEVQRVLGTDPLRSPAPFQPFRSPEDEAPEGGLVHGGAAEAAEGKGAGRDRGSSHGSAADTPGRRAPVTYATISKGLKYTQAVLQETLRLYPSVPKDVKQAVRDDTLPDGTFIPQGSLVAYLPHAMGRLETLWGPDADDFKPSRFLSEKYSPFKFIAFNAGPRTCLGQQLALVEASIVLSLLYRNYRVTVVPGQHITSLESLTLPMRSGIRAVISRR